MERVAFFLLRDVALGIAKISLTRITVLETVAVEDGANRDPGTTLYWMCIPAINQHWD